MSTLNDEILREVGRFALEFAGLEELVTTLAASILECSEREVAELQTEDLSLGRKLSLIGDVSKQLAGIYSLPEPFVALSTEIGHVKELLKDRNTVLHGEVIIKRREPPIVRTRKNKLELTPAELSKLVLKVDSAIEGLRSKYFDFMDAVYAARAAR